MGNPIANKLMQTMANRVLDRTTADLAKKSINSEDPYKVKVPKYDRNGVATGKFITKKRPLPEGLSANDRAVLAKVRKRAHRYDMMIHCCCIKFGIGSIIGLLIPFLGDVIDYLLALMLVWKANEIDGGLPLMLKARMMTNIAIDFGIGLVPVLGDVADAFYRANTRNCWILWTYLEAKAKVEREDAEKLGARPAIQQPQPSYPRTQSTPMTRPAPTSMQSNGVSRANPPGSGTWGNADLEKGQAPPRNPSGLFNKGRR